MYLCYTGDPISSVNVLDLESMLLRVRLCRCAAFSIECEMSLLVVCALLFRILLALFAEDVVHEIFCDRPVSRRSSCHFVASLMVGSVALRRGHRDRMLTGGGFRDLKHCHPLRHAQNLLPCRASARCSGC